MRASTVGHPDVSGRLGMLGEPVRDPRDARAMDVDGEADVRCAFGPLVRRLTVPMYEAVVGEAGRTGRPVKLEGAVQSALSGATVRDFVRYASTYAFLPDGRIYGEDFSAGSDAIVPDADGDFVRNRHVLTRAAGGPQAFVDVRTYERADHFEPFYVLADGGEAVRAAARRRVRGRSEDDAAQAPRPKRQRYRD